MELGELVDERFEIEHEIRAGGMGEVFRARDRRSNTPVAIKVLATGRDLRSARFEREIELLAELSHPGIVRYIGHGVTRAGRPFLAMEWLDGEDLKRRLERQPLTIAEAVRLVTRVAEALGAAHARGIVHRDLKPSNLFLPGGSIEQAKILDFGIAQKEGMPTLTQTGTLIGTPGYMAPEQARNHTAIDARADVFALGCVLFHCLTGSPPFEADSAVAVLGKVLFGEAPRVSALWPEVPEDLDALVAQMLASDPALRPADGANLAAALAALGPGAHAATEPAIRRPVPSSALTGGERRFLAVVVVGSAGAADTLDDPPAGDRSGGAAVSDAADDADSAAASDPASAALDAALRGAARPYGGRIERLIDGSTLVVLEVDRQVATDQAAQAARCALAIRAVAGDRPIAIAMGRVESTNQLSSGGVIDRASRLVSQLARIPGGAPPIALDEISAGLLDARFDVVESDAQLMLCGERALMQGARTLVGRPTSCVGRDWELNALGAILDECIEEPEARVVIVTAAAGIGKSRLGAEFVTRVQQRSDHVAIWIGRGDSLRAGSTLDLLAQALRGALGIQGGEPLAERHDRIRARVAAHVPATERKRVAEFLGELVGTPFSADGDDGAALRAARQDAQLMSEQMRRAWIDFLRAETSAHPVLLLLEDLQWGDFGTVRFIDTALRDRGGLPWMVLALARPEVFDVFPKLWAERQNVQEIRLKELGRKAGERLVRQVLGEDVGTQTIERLVRHADGNTFYLEELIRAAAEGKDRVLPETVLAMVETRLARLAVDARRVLRAASVFGEVCWDGAVTTLVGPAMTAAAVAEWFGKLVEQEVLAERPGSRFPGQREFMFRHALLREGAYATLTDHDRRLGHRLAGEWLVQHDDGNPIVLAGHFERGGDGTRAASYYLRAAEQAFHILDLEATMTRAALGLGCGPPHELRIALLGIRCEASCQGLQMIGAVMPDAEELIRSAPRGTVPWGQAMIAYIEGTMLAGRIPDLLAAIGELGGVTPTPDAIGRVALVFLAAVCILDALGQVREATALEGHFLATLRATGPREPLAQFWWNITVGMRASYAHGDPWNGLLHSNAIQPIYEVTGGERTHLNMELFRGLNLWYLGALDAARDTLWAIPAADDSLGVASSLRRFGLSWLLADRGELTAALQLATELAEYGRAHGNLLDEGRGTWVLAEVLRRLGRFDDAERALDVALARAVPLERSGVLGTLAALRLAQGRAGDALDAAAEAVASITAIGACGVFRGAFVHLVHAEALYASGARDAARSSIGEARRQLHTIADLIADPGYRASFLGAVPENARTLQLAADWLGDAS